MTASITDINAARQPLDFALRYIRLGLFVLPLEPGTKKPMGRLVPNGFHDATNDEAEARTWWSRHPDAGIGIAVRRSGWVVVDIDPRNGGIETMDALEAKHGPLVSDVLAYTGGGGEHRVFTAQLVENLPGKLGPGVDLKADGYIAVEPTIHPSGATYAWEASSDPLDGVVPSTLPGWIRDMRGAAPAANYIPPAVQPIEPRRLASAQEALASLPSDERDDWVKVGAAIHNEMPGQDGFSLWDAWSQQSPKYDPQDQIRVWRSFKVRGLGGVGLNTVFAMAQAAGWKNTGGPAMEHQAAPIEPAELVLTIEQLHARAAATRWAVKGVIPELGVGFFYGASQAFKSFLTLDYALHRAYGMKWLGKKTKQATPVYLAAEGGAGLMRRIQAWHQARGLDWKKCPMRVVIVALTLRTQAKALREAIQATGVAPGDLIVDTMSQTFTGDENSNDQVAEFLRILGTELRDGLQCTVTIVHHTGHSADNRMRGASAMHANVDFALGVSRDGKELLATMEFAKVKDAERPDPATFELTVQQLGKDEDGDPITSLAARHINNAEQLVEAHERERASGRGGRTSGLVALASPGMTFGELRKAFYESVVSEQDPEARRKAFNRALGEAKRLGLLDFGTDQVDNKTRIVGVGSCG